MLRLRLHSAPSPILLPGGVVIMARQAHQLARDAALAAAEAAAAQFAEAGDLAEEYGLPAGIAAAAGMGADPTRTLGGSVLLYAVELACIVGESWSGFADVDLGQTPPFEKRWITALFLQTAPGTRHTFARHFVDAAERHAAAEADEGNG